MLLDISIITHFILLYSLYTYNSPFFRQFNNDQLREICLIVDVAKLWGQQVLFEQGAKGYAFYSILEGSVQVWVRPENGISLSLTNTNPEGVRIGDLGILISSLPQGVTFGEQSMGSVKQKLETKSLRQSSVMTGEGLTYLLVMDMEEYEELLLVIKFREALDKVTLLR